MTPLPPPRRLWIDSTVLRFLAVGVFNTLVGLGVTFALKGLASWSDVAANAGGYTVGLAVSFVLNRRWTFDHQGHAASALLRFLLVFAMAYVLNLLVVLAALRAGVDPYLAQILGVPPYTVAFYLGSRRFAFAKPRASR